MDVATPVCSYGVLLCLCTGEYMNVQDEDDRGGGKRAAESPADIARRVISIRKTTLPQPSSKHEQTLDEWETYLDAMVNPPVRGYKLAFTRWIHSPGHPPIGLWVKEPAYPPLSNTIEMLHVCSECGDLEVYHWSIVEAERVLRDKEIFPPRRFRPDLGVTGQSRPSVIEVEHTSGISEDKRDYFDTQGVRAVNVRTDGQQRIYNQWTEEEMAAIFGPPGSEGRRWEDHADAFNATRRGMTHMPSFTTEDGRTYPSRIIVGEGFPDGYDPFHEVQLPSSRIGIYPYIEGITNIPCERKTLPGYFFHQEAHQMNCEPPKSKPEDGYTTFNPVTRLMEAGYDVGAFWENGIPVIIGIRYRLRDLIGGSTCEYPGKRTYEVSAGVTTDGEVPKPGRDSCGHAI